MWNLYGNQYNLTPFVNDHPGGADILLKTKGERDITVLFETYHAFSDKEKIKQILDKYKIINGQIIASKKYDFTNYDKLLGNIKKTFPNRESIKTTPFRNYIAILTTGAYIISYYHMIYCPFLIIQSLFAILAGAAYISLGFNVMHDASHYAVSLKPGINIWLTKIWNSWGLWNGDIWFYHHVYHHHSFTGVENEDPDLYHLRPFARKVKSDTKINSFFLSVQDRIAPFILFCIPGEYVGQSVVYGLASFKNRIFKIPIPNTNYYDTTDIILICCNMYGLSQMPYSVLACYFISLNLFYSINIIPDHDTYESSVENHYTGDDWCKLQICNSGNFLNDNLIWTHLFGSINYQIEHHLFPNMSSVHYPTIAPIVREFCKENNIKYVHHATIWSAYKSFIKMIKYNKLNQSNDSKSTAGAEGACLAVNCFVK